MPKGGEIARKKQARAMLSLYEKYKERGMTSGELRKERRVHEAKTELEVVRVAVKNLQAMKIRIAKLELAALDEEEKTRLTGEIGRFSEELEARPNEIISRSQPRRPA